MQSQLSEQRVPARPPAGPSLHACRGRHAKDARAQWPPRDQPLRASARGPELRATRHPPPSLRKDTVDVILQGGGHGDSLASLLARGSAEQTPEIQTPPPTTRRRYIRGRVPLASATTRPNALRRMRDHAYFPHFLYVGVGRSRDGCSVVPGKRKHCGAFSWSRRPFFPAGGGG